MSSKRTRRDPVFVEKDEKREFSDDSMGNVERIKAFRTVYAHFSDARKAKVKVAKSAYPETPTLEIRQAMQHAKSSYDSMVDIQERLNQAYHEIMRDPS